MNKVSTIDKFSFPNACQLMRWHFHPIGFEATMDAPQSMVARLFDRTTGQTMLAIAGIPCTSSMSSREVARIIQAVEDELESFQPPMAWQA